MPGWDTTYKLVREEFAQLRDEGRDANAIQDLRAEFDALNREADDATLHDLWRRMLALPVPASLEESEPNDLEGIRARRDPALLEAWNSHAGSVDFNGLFDKMHGAWLGRCAGCALGKPSEGFMSERSGIASKDRLKKYLQAISPDEYPLRDYLPQHSPAEEETGKLWCRPSTREHIAFMESDDDIRYTVLGQIVMRKKGRDFTSRDVAEAWLEFLPFKFVCTAETQAYRNLVVRHEFHLAREDDASFDWGWVATNENPYREWIGAQIRADSWGYAAPGNPELAAEFAWRDARISHVRSGIYGEMLCAAMIAAAFVSDDPRAIVHAGLAQIPSKSRLFAEMQQVLAICDKHDCDASRFEQVLDDIYALLGHYHAVHTDNNAALVIAALLLGKHDFHEAITIAVMGGWDSDCNGATVGSIVGAMIGASKLPEHWTARLNDTLYSAVVDYHPIAISECARRSVEIARAVVA